MNFLKVTGRNQVSLIPITVTGEITVGYCLNGSHIYDQKTNEKLIGYDLKVSKTSGTFLTWKVMEIINKNHGYTGKPYIYLVVMPLHDSSGNCFPRREVWVQEGLNDLLPCGHVRGYCTCKK